MNIWKIIYLNCGERYEFVIDRRSYTHNLSSCEIKAWKNKKFRPERDSNPWPLRYRLSYQAIRELVTLRVCNIPVEIKDVSEYIFHTYFPFRPKFFFSGFNFTTAQVVCVTATINHKFVGFYIASTNRFGKIVAIEIYCAIVVCSTTM